MQQIHIKYNLMDLETKNLHGDGMLTGRLTVDDLTMNWAQGSGGDDEKRQK